MLTERFKASMNPFLTRRDLLIGGTSLATALMPSNAASMTPLNDQLYFTAFRNGSRLGHHRLTLSADGDLQIVEIEIVFDLSFTIIPLYRYRHHNREVWQNNRLVELVAKTDDDGEAYEVRAAARGDRLLVEGSGGRLDLPGKTMSTSYWNEAIGRRGVWLDTQSGKLVTSKVEARPVERVRAAGSIVEAKPYILTGDIACKLWYRDGTWVKLNFVGADGSIIDYELDLPSMAG